MPTVKQPGTTQSTAEFNYDRFCMSLSLESHPLLNEKKSIRIKYLNVISWFIDKYASEDKTAKAIFNNYIKILMKDENEFQRDEEKKYSANLKSLFRHRIKKFKLFSFRYILLCDLSMIISPFDEKTSLSITSEIKSILYPRNRKSINACFELLYNNKQSKIFFYLIKDHIHDWRTNRNFFSIPERNILVSANMSAGKSSLINAVVGKKINRSMNQACTAKFHYIKDKPFEDNFTSKFDYNIDFNADLKTLMENNPKNKTPKISVATYFRYTGKKHIRLSFIDTPGVNHSLDKEQESLKQTIVSHKFDVFLYVINAEHIGTIDDFYYLNLIKDKIDNKNIIFVLNKLDKFKAREDNISESVHKLKEFLASLGFINNNLCPVSTRAGFLAKQAIYNCELNDEEDLELELMLRIFNQPEFDLSKFYDERITLDDMILKDKSKQKHYEVLLKSGILNLERILYANQKEELRNA